MRSKALTISLIISLFSLCYAQEKKSAEWTVEDIIKQTSVSNVQFSSDGKSLVWVHRRPSKKKDRYVSDLWMSRLDMEEKDGYKQIQLTRSEASDFSPLFSADGQTLYFLSSRNKGNQLWAMSMMGGEAYAVDSFANGISSIRWLNDHQLLYLSHEGKTLYQQELKKKKDNVVVVYDSTHQAPRRLFAYDIKSKEKKRLTDNRYRIGSYAVSPDGNWVATSHIRSPHYGYDGKPKPWYFIWDLSNGGSKRQILQGLQEPGGFQFAADSKGFYFRATQSSDPEWNGAGIQLLYYYDLSTNEYEKVPIKSEWGLSGGSEITENGILIGLANGPTGKMCHMRKDGKKWRKEEFSAGEMDGHISFMEISKDHQQLAFSYSTASIPSQYRLAKLEVMDKGLKLAASRPFASVNKHLDKKTKAKTEVIRWTGALDDEITGILYYPHDYTEGKSYPLMIGIHGGPTGTDRDRWSDRWAYYHNILAQKGCFILKPNYHGSGSHGQEFMESIKGHYYEYELPDIIAGIDYLEGRGLINKDSMALLGWSNGAILATMLTVEYPDMFLACAPGAGDVNWTSDYGTCGFGVTFDQSYFIGAPWDDTDGKTFNPNYIDKSPLFELEKVKTPTLICHGSEDRSVPRDQGWEYFHALQQVGEAPVRFLWFPGQPHGLQKLSHQRRKMEEELKWFDKYFFGREKPENEAFKKGSPLMAMLEKQKAAWDSQSGSYGQISGDEKKLVPEMVLVKKDSIEISRFELTHAQFQAFFSSHSFPPSAANQPITGLGLREVEAYLEKLNAYTGSNYRLPSAVEAAALHKAAQKVAAKENSLNYWAGYKITPDELAMFEEKLSEVSRSLIMEVGRFSSSKVGEAKVYDLGGNASEAYLEDGKLKSYGYSAYDYVDAFDKENGADAAHRGIRLVRDLK